LISDTCGAIYWGGITAGIVALPLALAFGEQSGLGAAAGLYGAAFIAFFAALFGGTPTQISGPTAPMTALSMVVIASLLQTYEGRVEDALPVILMIFLIAGLLQVLLGVFKLGSYVKYIPYTVVSGFMSGIGVIILITQLSPMLGYNAIDDEEVVQEFIPQAEEIILERILKDEAEDGILVLEDFKETISRAELVSTDDIRLEAELLAANDARGITGNLKYLPRAISNIDWMEFILCMITIGIIYGFKRITNSIPSTLVSLLLVSGVAYSMGLDYLPISKIPSGYPSFHFEVFTNLDFLVLAPFLFSALLLAMLGSIDSLLTSVVADNLTKTHHKPNRELIGQGIGNSIASLFGGLPGAGATIRTVVNIQAGGRTKISGMISGILLFVILIMLGPIASEIPAAVLAGILITVGFGVMDYKGLKAIPKMETSEWLILLTVLVLTVAWQLVYAVAVGLIMAAFVFMKRMSDISISSTGIADLQSDDVEEQWKDELEIDSDLRERVVFKHLDGPMFFGVVNNFRSLVSELEAPQIDLLVIRMENVPFMDQSGVFALESAIEELHQHEVVVALTGVNRQVRKMLNDMKIVPYLIPTRLIFEDTEDCRDWLRTVLQKEGGMAEEQDYLF